MASNETQLIIDIAAKLTGNETTAQLDAMSRALSGTSKWAESLDAAMIQAKSGLSAASAEVQDVTASLAAARDAFQRVAKAEGEASAAAFTYAAKVAALEGDLEAATKAQAHYQQQLDNTAKLTGRIRQRTGDAATRMSTFRGALGDAGGMLGDFAGRLMKPAQAFVELREHFGGATAALVTGVGVFAQVAVAAVAAAAAVGAMTAAVVALGLSLADTNRSAGLTLEAMEAMHPELVGLRDVIEATSEATGMHKDELQEWAGRLKDAKIAAKDIPAALEAVALAETALGQGGGNDLLDQMKANTQAAGKLAAATKAKLGGIVEKQMLSLSATGERAKKVFANLFGGLEIESALAGISKLVDMFTESHVVGRTIKFFFETLFQPFIDSIEGAYYAVEAFVLGFLIGMTKIYIGLKPVIAAVAELLGFEDSTFEDGLHSLTAAGELLAPVFVGAVVAITAFVGAILIAVAAVAAAPIAFIAAITAIVGAFQSALDWIAGIDMYQVATDLWQGFIDGIVAFGPNVVSSITGVVGGAIDSAKALLGIASPSKVFAEIGENTGEGFTMGVEDTETAAQGALATMVEPPSATPAGAPASSAQSSAAARPAISLEGLTFNFYGVEGAEQAQDRFTEAFTRLLEGDATALGAT